MKAHCFFAHIAFASDAWPHLVPEATANLLIEINGAALRSGRKKEEIKVSDLTEPEKVRLAGGIAKTAALDYLKAEGEFRQFSKQRFVDFNLTGTPTYISIRPPATKVFPNHSKVWRLAETEAESVRGEPLPGSR